MLLNGVVRVIEIDVKRIREGGCGFLKRNTMLLKIGRRLFFVPLIIHTSEYSI